MKRFTHTFLVFSILMLVAVSGLFAQGGSQRYSLAVLNLSGSSLNSSDVKLVTSELTQEITRTGMFFTMSEADMERGLMTKGLDADLGCSDIGCATRAGRALGVQLVVFGEVRKSGPGYVMDAKMLHVASGEIVKSEVRNIDGGFRNVLDQMPVFAQNLMGIRNGAAPRPVPGAVESARTSRPGNPPQRNYPPAQPQSYKKSGGSKWLYIGLGALVAGGVGAGVLLLSGDDGGNSGPGNGTTNPPPTGNLGGPPTFP